MSEAKKKHRVYPYTRTTWALRDAIGLMRDLGRTEEVVRLQAMLERLERDYNN